MLRNIGTSVFILAALCLLLAGCSTSASTGGRDDNYHSVGAPSVNPAGGDYKNRAQTIVVRATTQGSTLHWKLNGTERDPSSTTLLIPILQDAALEAWATLSGSADSTVVKGTYTFSANGTPGTAIILDPLTYQGIRLTGPAWYRIDAYQGDTLTILLASTTAGLGLELYDSAQKRLAVGTGTDTGQQIRYDVTTTGSYYIQVLPTATKSVPVKQTTTRADDVTYTLSVSTGAPDQVAAPIFAPVAGTYKGPLSVYLVCSTGGSQIYYTTDGSAPSKASTLYTGSIILNASATINAIGVREGLADSRVATAVYVITGAITGRITNSLGEPIGGANVSLNYDIDGKMASAITQPDGTYTIIGVPPGTYQITAKHPSYLPKTEPVSVASGQTTVKDMVLEWKMVRPSNLLFKVWSRADLGIFAVGSGGRILRSQDGGTTWTTMTSGVEVDLTAVWGCSDSADVYAIGTNGTILHWSGSGVTWSKMTSGATEDLFGLYGFGKNDVFVVGERGVILHYDGTAWVRMARPDSEFSGKGLVAIWGTGPADVHAVGEWGRMIHYDGTKWTEYQRLIPNTLLAMWGFDATHIYAVGGGTELYPLGTAARSKRGFEGVTKLHVLFFDGTKWSIVKDELGPRLMAVWGSSAADLYMAGADGKTFRLDGTNLIDLGAPTAAWILGLYGTTPGEFIAVGQSGVKLRYKSATWTALGEQEIQALYGIWAASATEVFAVGDKTTNHLALALRSQDGGDTWTEMSPVGAPMLAKAWGTAANSMWAVGAMGTVVYWNGTTWTPQTVPNPAGPFLWGVRGTGNTEVYAVGDNGTVLGFNGAAWSALPKPADMVGKTINAVCPFRIGGTTTVIVGGEGGKIFKTTDNGTNWTSMDPPTTAVDQIMDMYGLSPDELFAVGKKGTFLYYHQGAWTRLDLDPGQYRIYTGVWGWGTAGVFSELICVGQYRIFQYINAAWRDMANGAQEPMSSVWGALVDPLDASKGLRAWSTSLGGGIYRYVRNK